MAKCQATRSDQLMYSRLAAEWKRVLLVWGHRWSEAEFLFSAGQVFSRHALLLLPFFMHHVNATKQYLFILLKVIYIYICIHMKYSPVGTAVGMHHQDANKTAREEARRQLHKNVGSNIEQVLAATPYKAPTIRPRKLSKLDEPDTQDSAGEAGTSSSVMYSYGPPHMAEQKLDHIYSSYVRIRDVALKTCQRQWTIRKSGERGC